MRQSGDLYDVVIIGGGLTGLTLAALLDAGSTEPGAQLRVALLDQNPPPDYRPGQPLDMRVSALMPASRAIMDTLDVWGQLPADRVSPYQRMCVWQAAGAAGGARSVSFDAAELGVRELGYIVENLALRQVLWSKLAANGRVELLTDTAPSSLHEQSNAIEIRLSDHRCLRARLVVGADGANSWVRQQLGIEFNQRSYEQAAIVAHLETAKPHDATAWQRFLATGPVALLPLADGSSSLVWSVPAERATELLNMDDSAFNRELGVATDHVLGDIRCRTSRVSFPLAMGYASHYTGERFALIGDAAHRIHPLAGQGANLGLLDAAVLADKLAAHLRRPLADPGDPFVLRAYERARKGDNLLTMGAMDALHRVFSGSAAGLASLGGLGFEVADRCAPLKNRFARYAMGARRDLPAAAQPRGLD